MKIIASCYPIIWSNALLKDIILFDVIRIYFNTNKQQLSKHEYLLFNRSYSTESRKIYWCTEIQKNISYGIAWRMIECAVKTE